MKDLAVRADNLVAQSRESGSGAGIGQATGTAAPVSGGLSGLKVTGNSGARLRRMRILFWSRLNS